MLFLILVVSLVIVLVLRLIVAGLAHLLKPVIIEASGEYPRCVVW